MNISENLVSDNCLVPAHAETNKPIIKKRVYNKPVILIDISYENYINDKLELDKFKLPTIKEAVRKYKLKLSGKKSELIDRLITHFKSITYAIKIQTVFRRWLVIQMNRLRGPAFKNIQLCVNESDFSTLEPLDEIPKSNFFSLTDQNKFTYGFNISSLIELLKQNYNACNPYNREKFNNKTKNEIITLYRCCFINLPYFKNENEPYSITNYNSHIVRPIRRSLPILDNTISYNPRINTITTHQQLIQFNNIRTIRFTPVDNRITQLFIAIDQLGNYTNKEWFSELDIRGYIRLYRALYEIWYLRSGLTNEVRHNISPFCQPFDGIFNQRVLHSDLSLEQIQTACLIVFENLVYSGIDDEYKRLGTFHALSALTMVSRGARIAMPWLYESVML
jgi:hypothetical protein